MHNEYGPTESTVGCVVATLLPGDTRVLIGRPIYDTGLLITDPTGRAVPPLFAGELWVAGAGVGRGYLGNADAAAPRFTTHPALSGRAYRTGDRVRALASGELDYLGRVDEQIEIRGYRIEPGEIEQRLFGIPESAKPCHLPRQSALAYVVGKRGRRAA